MRIAPSVAALMATQRTWVSDAGLETDIIFNAGIDLPHFASITLLDSAEGREALDAYFERYLVIAKNAGTGFLLDSATWRSGVYWADTLGRSKDDMLRASANAVSHALLFRSRNEHEGVPMVINGVVGPAGDGYQPDALYTPEEAYAIHLPQVQAMADAGAELISAITITHPGEAIGIARAAQDVGLPCVVSFTVETDGRLPTGETIQDAIAETDFSLSAKPIYYMINCAHPDHFSGELGEGDWRLRIGGVRANASRMSHAELDEAEELDDGDPQEFGALYGALAELLPNLRVIGGCCGSDHRHIACAAHHVVAPAATAA